MAARDEIMAARLAGNIEDVMEHGPRLALGRSTWVEGRCAADPSHVLTGGLGAMGVGIMWTVEYLEPRTWEDGSVTAPITDDPTYAEAPIVEGCTICTPIDWANYYKPTWPTTP